jgi:drug/metabolite transporter (DMT)-like permease
MTANDNRIDTRDWSLLGLLSVLWGGSFFFNGVVLRELPPLTVVLLRVALAAMILLPVLWACRIRFPVGLSGWTPFFAIALLNNVLPFSLIVIGQTYIPGGLASILNATTPLFTVVVMAAAGEEKLHPRRVAGVVTGLIGVIILHGRDLHGQGFHGQVWAFRPGRGSASCSALPRPSAMDYPHSMRGVNCRTRLRLRRRRFNCWRQV